MGPSGNDRLRYHNPPTYQKTYQEIPDVYQTWYTDNYRVLDTSERIDTYFNLLTRQGLGN